MSIASRMSTRGTISLFLSRSVTPAHSPWDLPGRSCAKERTAARGGSLLAQDLREALHLGEHGGDAADDQALHFQPAQHEIQVGAEEGAAALLGDHGIAVDTTEPSGDLRPPGAFREGAIRARHRAGTGIEAPGLAVGDA